jgi:hypothetical protein
MRQAEYNRLDFDSSRIQTINSHAESSGNEGKVITVTLSVNLFGSIQLNRFVLLFYSYDINTSKLGNTQGVHELSLTWQIWTL